MYPTPIEEKEAIAKIVNRYIEENDSSFRELGEVTNISHQTFAHWANARHRPHAITLTIELNHVKAHTPAWVYGMFRELLDVIY